MCFSCYIFFSQNINVSFSSNDNFVTKYHVFFYSADGPVHGSTYDVIDRIKVYMMNYAHKIGAICRYEVILQFQNLQQLNQAINVQCKHHAFERNVSID